MSDSQRTVEVMPRMGGDYKIQDTSDAVTYARGIEGCAKAIKGDLQGHQIRDALRHTMQLAQSLVELQTWLMAQRQ